MPTKVKLTQREKGQLLSEKIWAKESKLLKKPLKNFQPKTGKKLTPRELGQARILWVNKQMKGKKIK